LDRDRGNEEVAVNVAARSAARQAAVRKSFDPDSGQARKLESALDSEDFALSVLTGSENRAGTIGGKFRSAGRYQSHGTQCPPCPGSLGDRALPCRLFPVKFGSSSL